MNPLLNNSDWEPDPFESPWSSGEPLDPQPRGLAYSKKTLSITHDLTDDELRRFVEFDVYYDPMPMLGFIPQWLVIVLITGAAGAGMGLMTASTTMAMVQGGLALPIVMLGILHITAAAHRRQARASGLCDGRTVTISPRGLAVEIPFARGASMIAIGPMKRSWSDIRKISISENDLTFWMQPTFLVDLEGRARLIVPLRAFASAGDAATFEQTARCWHAAATGGDAHWWNEAIS
jgi:hypothetical protein